jgi:hypothetical protein
MYYPKRCFDEYSDGCLICESPRAFKTCTPATRSAATFTLKAVLTTATISSLKLPFYDKKNMIEPGQLTCDIRYRISSRFAFQSVGRTEECQEKTIATFCFRWNFLTF